MFSSLRAAAVGAMLCLAAPASATIFYSNYAPSDTAATFQEHFHPLEYRAPDASQSFDNPASLGAYCTYSSCPGFNFYSVATEFTATSSFSTSHLIVPVRVGGSYGNFRVGFGLSRFDTETGEWVGLGSATIESGLVPTGAVREVEIPFGVSGARYIDFNYQPVSIVAGERYRLVGGWGTGAAGDMTWYASDAAATPGQSTEYYGGFRFSQANSRALGLQPAFALTDGGTLQQAVSAIPEPSTWLMMILGFGMAGMMIRRGRSGVALPMSPRLAAAWHPPTGEGGVRTGAA